MAEKKEEKQYEFEPVEEDELFRFESIGDIITGRLLEKDTSTKYNVGLYDIETIDGDTKRVLGKTQLDRLMEKVAIGSVVKIEFIKERETPTGTLKLFRVSVAKMQ